MVASVHTTPSIINYFKHKIGINHVVMDVETYLAPRRIHTDSMTVSTISGGLLKTFTSEISFLSSAPSA